MRKNIILFLAGTTILATPALAEPEIAPGADIVGVTVINEGIADVEDAVQDDFDRSFDIYRHSAKRPDGTSGGVSLSYFGTDGNDEGHSLNLGGRVTHSSGPFTQNVGVLLSYEKDEDETTRNESHVIYDALYDFSPRTYAFALGRLSVDGTVDDDLDAYRDGTLDPADALVLDGKVKRDAFLGFGPGYRIIDNQSTAWRVQGGVGVRYVQSVDLTELDYLDSDTGTGYLVSSRFWHEFSPRVSVTNDTDYLESDANEIATNELALNYKFSESMVGRASYTTEYVSDRAERTDNTLGVSIGFNF